MAERILTQKQSPGPGGAAAVDGRTASAASFPVCEVLDVEVHAATCDQVVAYCEASIDRRERLRLGVVNAAKLVHMRGDRLLRESVTSSDLVFADGMSVVWASRVLGNPLPGRVTGIDLFERLLASAARRGDSVFLLGAKQDVLDDLVGVLRARHPDLKIAGTRSGYFSDEQSLEVATEVRNSEATMLFVGISSPKKERFLALHGHQLGVAVCHGVGGSFDVVAGKTQRAPEMWQRLGLEWLYRLLQEPRRMWKRYLVTNTVFVALVARAWLARLFRGRVSS